MHIWCYQSSAEPNRVDKTDYLTLKTHLEGVLRSDESILNPKITLQFPAFPSINYMYIEELNRYYFVTDIIIENNNLYTFMLDIDVLMTYKDGIRTLDGFIDRNEYMYDKKLVDTRRAITNEIDVETVAIDNVVFSSSSFILSGLNVYAGTEDFA